MLREPIAVRGIACTCTLIARTSRHPVTSRRVVTTRLPLGGRVAVLDPCFSSLLKSQPPTNGVRANQIVVYVWNSVRVKTQLYAGYPTEPAACPCANGTSCCERLAAEAAFD